ncbi:MAG: NarL family transcriptional regulator [Bacteroidetes bacterium]|nr:MAG: NarL family transcriptional regulator [Bacteroidota bacterium]
MSYLVGNQGSVERTYLYAKAVFGEEEKQAVLRSMNNGWLASGPLVSEFEQKIAALFGKKYGIATNSGSSANLLALSSLNLPAGCEVITPACTFATTVSPIVQAGLVPVFVDSVVGRYTINEDLVEEAISDKTRAIMVPHLVGGVVDLPKLRKLADLYHLVLIDDSCDTLAPKLDGKPIARFSDLATTSFYGSHIITALGMGGMILTDDVQLRDRIINMRDWGRLGDDKESFEKRFDFEIDGIPYDQKFIYTSLGYNLKMNEAAAAFGLEQLKKLPSFLEKRERNFNMLQEYFQKYKKWFILPKLIDGATTNWLAYPLTIRPETMALNPEVPFTRYDFLKHLEDNGVQTRVLFSGNITRHPAYRTLTHRIPSPLSEADEIMAGGLLIGLHQGIEPEDIQTHIIDVCERFFENL